MVLDSELSRDPTERVLPHGPHSLTREEVLSNQRARLIAAMSAAVGEQGYGQTTVAHVIALAGVSRKAFYQHFSNREECFMETYDTIVQECVRQAQRACENAGSTQAAVRIALETVFDRVLEDPLDVRLVLVEVAALGRTGESRREELVGVCEQRLLAGAKPRVSSSPIMRAVVGGVSHVLATHVRTAREHLLHRLTPELVEWMTSYDPAPGMVDTIGMLADGGEGRDLLGGRAPGTLWPAIPATGRRRGLRGEHIGSRSFVVHSQRERILDAVASLSATKGYAAVTVKDISETAAVSLDAFYEHFEGKEDAFLVAYEIGHGKGRVLVERAYDRASDWRGGVRAALYALFWFLASEPSFAHLALVDARVASARTADRAVKGMAAYGQLFMPRLNDVPTSQRPPAVVIDAILGGVFELCLSYTLQDRSHELPKLTPLATYFTLAPFVGSAQAKRVALGERGGLALLDAAPAKKGPATAAKPRRPRAKRDAARGGE